MMLLQVCHVLFSLFSFQSSGGSCCPRLGVPAEGPPQGPSTGFWCSWGFQERERSLGGLCKSTVLDLRGKEGEKGGLAVKGLRSCARTSGGSRLTLSLGEQELAVTFLLCSSGTSCRTGSLAGFNLCKNLLWLANHFPHLIQEILQHLFVSVNQSSNQTCKIVVDCLIWKELVVFLCCCENCWEHREQPALSNNNPAVSAPRPPCYFPLTFSKEQKSCNSLCGSRECVHVGPGKMSCPWWKQQCWQCGHNSWAGSGGQGMLFLGRAGGTTQDTFLHQPALQWVTTIGLSSQHWWNVKSPFCLCSANVNILCCFIFLIALYIWLTSLVW